MGALSGLGLFFFFSNGHHALNGNWYNIRRSKCQMSQRTTKPTKILMRPAKIQIGLRIRAVRSVCADRMCLLQPPGYPRREEREPFPYWKLDNSKSKGPKSSA